MNTTSIICRAGAAAALAVTAAVLVLPSALATGEPKNVPPFTQPSHRSLTHAVTSSSVSSTDALSAKEAKKGIWFATGVRSDGSASILTLRGGEPKNVFPFVRK